jgi:hypothetical protein
MTISILRTLVSCKDLWKWINWLIDWVFRYWMQTKLISSLSLNTRIIWHFISQLIRVSTSITQLRIGRILNMILSIGFTLSYDYQNVFCEVGFKRNIILISRAFVNNSNFSRYNANILGWYRNRLEILSNRWCDITYWLTYVSKTLCSSYKLHQ